MTGQISDSGTRRGGRWLWRVLLTLVVVLALLVGAVWLTTFHPAAVQAEPVSCTQDAPTLQPGQQLRVLSWNVQYMAGKDYVFYYDLLDGSGPDERPSPQAIDATFEAVQRVIAEEDPDLVLLQEVDDGAARTDGEDQLARLLAMPDMDYPCSASAFYWQAAWVPHPRILGSVGMKLSTLSRYRIDSATRHRLPVIPADPLTEQFGLKRAILEVRLPVEGGADLVAYNTHLDAFAQGTDTMQRQVAIAADLLADTTAAGEPWLLAGDLNLLPPGRQYEDLDDTRRAYYLPESELGVLTDAYPVVPSLEEANGPDRTDWFTHLPNNPAVDRPDRTIDYVFHSPLLTLGEHRVRQDDTWTISDHLPVLADLTLP